MPKTEVTMTPVHQISSDMNNDDWLSKMRRPSYAGWKRREAEAIERAEKLKERTSARS